MPCVHGSSCHSMQCPEVRAEYQKLGLKVDSLDSFLEELEHQIKPWVSNCTSRVFANAQMAFKNALSEISIEIEENLS